MDQFAQLSSDALWALVIQEQVRNKAQGRASGECASPQVSPDQHTSPLPSSGESFPSRGPSGGANSPWRCSGALGSPTGELSGKVSSPRGPSGEVGSPRGASEGRGSPRGQSHRDEQLYLALSELVLRRDDYPSPNFFPPDVCPTLLSLLAEQHEPQVVLIVCVLLRSMCKGDDDMREKLAGRGAIYFLLDVLRNNPIPLGAEGRPAATRLVTMLVEHVTGLLHFFSLGTPLCTAKLNASNAIRVLSRLIDKDNVHLFRYGSAQALLPLVNDRILVAERCPMTMAAATNVYYTLFGDTFKMCVSLTNPYVLDLFDTSQADDVRLCDMLREYGDEVWMYAERGQEIEIVPGLEPVGQWVDVKVTNVVDSGYCWAVFGDDFDLLEDLEVCLTLDMYALETQPRPGQHVCAANETIGHYRAQVVSGLEDGRCRVFAVDHGFVSLVHWRELKQLAPHPKLRVSGLAHLCKIMGVRPVPVSRVIVGNVLDTLCNMTIDCSDKMTGLLMESRLVDSLCNLCTCPDLALQVAAVQVCSNLALKDALQVRLPRSALCGVIVSIASQHLPVLATDAASARLIESCVALLTNLMYNCEVNKDILIQLKGVHLLIALMGPNVPVIIKDTASRALKVFVGPVNATRRLDPPQPPTQQPASNPPASIRGRGVTSGHTASFQRGRVGRVGTAGRGTGYGRGGSGIRHSRDDGSGVTTKLFPVIAETDEEEDSTMTNQSNNQGDEEADKEEDNEDTEPVEDKAEESTEDRERAKDISDGSIEDFAGHKGAYVLGERTGLRCGPNCELSAEQSLKDVTLEAIARLICAFLNQRGGGCIYYGVGARTRVVEGVEMEASERDHLRLCIDKLTSRFTPAVVPGSVSTLYHDVIVKATGAGLPDRRVVEIKVRSPPSFAVPHRVIMNSAPIGYMRRGANTVEMSLKDVYVWYVETLETPKAEEMAMLRADINHLRTRAEEAGLLRRQAAEAELLRAEIAQLRASMRS